MQRTTSEETTFSTLLEGHWELVIGMVDNYFNIPDTAQATLVCKEWNGFFNSHNLLAKKLQKKISDEFGINFELVKLKRFTNNITILKMINQHLACLKKRAHLLPSFLQGFCSRAVNHASLLVCCTDNPSLFFDSILPEFYPAWEQIAITAGCNNIANHFFEMSQDKPAFVKMAVQALNLDLLIAIQQRPDSEKTGLDLDRQIVFCAAALGDLERIKAIFQSENEYLKELLSNKDELRNKLPLSKNPNQLIHLILDRSHMLRVTARSGNLDAFRYLFSLVEPSPFEFSLFEEAVRSDNTELMDYLIKEHPAEIEGVVWAQMDVIALALQEKCFKMALHLLTTFNITPEPDLVDEIVSCGNMECFNYLLGPRFSLKDDLATNQARGHELLGIAASGGCLNVVRYLISTFHLSPSQETLSQAAKSGNTALMRYLLHPDNNFQLVLHPSCFWELPSSELLQLMKEYNVPLAISFEQKAHLMYQMVCSVKDNGQIELFNDFINPDSNFLSWLPTSYQSNAPLLNDMIRWASGLKNIPHSNDLGEAQKDIANNMISHLLVSAVCGHHCFVHLHHYGTTRFNETKAKEFISETFDHSTHHFSQLLSYIMNSPHFSDEAKQFFISETTELSSRQTTLPVVRKYLSPYIKAFTPSAESTPGEKIKEETPTEKETPPTVKLNRGP